MPVPVDFGEVLARCRRVLERHGKTLITQGYSLKDIRIFEVEYRAGSKVKEVPDLWALAKDLQAVESVETPGGEFAEMRQ